MALRNGMTGEGDFTADAIGSFATQNPFNVSYDERQLEMRYNDN